LIDNHKSSRNTNVITIIEIIMILLGLDLQRKQHRLN